MASQLAERPLEKTLDEDVLELRRLLRLGYSQACDYYQQVRARHGDVPELAYWARILAPQPAVLKRGSPSRDPNDDVEWFKAHAREYWGQWLAVYDGQLIAHGTDSSAVLREARAKSPHPEFVFFYAGEY
jgi:hypothetical protein